MMAYGNIDPHIGSGNSLFLDSTKPLPGPMLTWVCGVQSNAIEL